MRESYALTGDEQPVDRVEVNGKMVKFPCYTRVYCIYDDKVIIGVYQDFMEATFTKEQWGKNIWCYRVSVLMNSVPPVLMKIVPPKKRFNKINNVYFLVI